MAKNDGQIRQEATGGLEGLAIDAAKAGVTGAPPVQTTKMGPSGPRSTEEAKAAADAKAAPAIDPLIEAVSPLAARVCMEPHKLAREYALAAASKCRDAPKLIGPSAEQVRRLLRIALAHLEGL